MLTTLFKTSLRSNILMLFFAFVWGNSFSQNPPPCVLTCPSNITVNNDPGKCGAVVTFTPTTSGNCSGITSTQASGSFFPIGTTTVNVSSGSQSCSFTVKVNDNERPVIESVTATPNVLWSPNHKMVPVAIKIASRDNCGIAECKIISVTSNEPVNGLGDGDTEPDWQIVDNTHVNLRAERSGRGNGRIYTITVQCTDIHQNSSTSTVLVTVPHDQSSKTIEKTDKTDKNNDKTKRDDDDKKIKKVKQKK